MGSASRTVRTWTRYLLLGLAGLYVACGLAGTVGVLFAAASAENDVEARLPATEREADRSREEVRRSLQSPPTELPPRVRDPRPVGAASYSWRELRCEIRSIDSGWIAVDFEQACDLVDVDLHPTSLRPSEGSADTGVGWSVEPDPPAASSEQDPATGTLGRCGYVPTEDLLPDYRRWPNDPGLTLWEPPASISVHLATGQQLQADPRRTGWSCPSEIMAPPQWKDSVLLSGRRPEQLLPDSSWVVVTRTDQVSRSRLGCNPWLVVFCTSPLPAPRLPDL